MFALPEFDPNEYANAVLAGEPYPHTAAGSSGTSNKAIGTGNLKASSVLKSAANGHGTEDVSVAISKLTYSIEDVEKQLKNVVRL